MGETLVHRLPSADWLAFTVGAMALVFQYYYPPLLGVVALAVFAPSVLREMNILQDADEWTRSVMHRAGFHALLVTAVFIFMGHLAPGLGIHAGGGGFGPKDVFGGETLRKAIVWVFLISYLLQYWGPRTGTFRILLGVAGMTSATTAGFFKHPGGMFVTMVLVVQGIALLFVGLAFLVRWRPRTGGAVLLGLCIVAFAFTVNNMADPRLVWGQLSLMFQAFLVLGVTGLSLLRDHS